MKTIPQLLRYAVPPFSTMDTSWISSMVSKWSVSQITSRIRQTFGRGRWTPQGVIWCRFIFSGVIWCRFIFSGKNDELTPDFPPPDFPPTPDFPPGFSPRIFPLTPDFPPHIADEGLLPAVPLLGNVVRQTRHNSTSHSGQDARLSAAGPVKDYVWCPLNSDAKKPMA